MIQNADFLSDSNKDMLIVDGDFVIENADVEHVEDIFQASLGHWKEFPLIGISIDSYRNSSGMTNELARVAKLQLESDNYQVDQLQAVVNGDDVQIYLTGNKNKQ